MFSILNGVACSCSHRCTSFLWLIFIFYFQVSFFSTSPELSNKQRFEYFSRTIPSDHYQVKAMVEIVKLLGWSYISIIYEESNYGVKAFEELEELLAEHSICIAVKEKLVKDSGVAQERAYDTIVQKLMTKSRARGELIREKNLVKLSNFWKRWNFVFASELCLPHYKYSPKLTKKIVFSIGIWTIWRALYLSN